MPQDQPARPSLAAAKSTAIAVPRLGPMTGPMEQLRMLAQQQPDSVLQVLSQWLRAAAPGSGLNR